ncbi:MAG TPA: hypothetical protein VF148_11720 [Acidimicrobiia bacterium]
MQFKGKLLLPDEPGPGLSVNLDVAAHHLAVESDGGGLGAWPLEVVDVERLEGDVFALTVAGEPLRFVADDTIAFAYSGVPTIEQVSPRTRSRSAIRTILDRIWKGPDESASSGAQPASPEASNTYEPPEEDLSHAMDQGLSPVVEDWPLVAVDEDRPLVVEGDWPRAGEEGLPPAGESVSTSHLGNTLRFPVIDDADVIGGGEGVVHPPTTDQPPLDDDLADAAGCPAIRGDGRRCESPILTSSGYCYPHDPKRAFEDRYQAAQEAREQLKRDSTARLNRIYARLDKAMRQVERGELDPETAMAMAQLARTMCAILDIDEPSAGDR